MFGKMKEFDEKLDAWADTYIEDHLIPQAKKELKEILTSIVMGYMTKKE